MKSSASVSPCVSVARPDSCREFNSHKRRVWLKLMERQSVWRKHNFKQLFCPIGLTLWKVNPSNRRPDSMGIIEMRKIKVVTFEYITFRILDSLV
jgi:hypothetical protein